MLQQATSINSYVTLILLGVPQLVIDVNTAMTCTMLNVILLTHWTRQQRSVCWPCIFFNTPLCIFAGVSEMPFIAVFMFWVSAWFHSDNKVCMSTVLVFNTPTTPLASLLLAKHLLTTAMPQFTLSWTSPCVSEHEKESCNHTQMDLQIMQALICFVTPQGPECVWFHKTEFSTMF